MRVSSIGNTIFDAAAANGNGTTFRVEEYKNIILAVTISGTISAGTLKLVGSIGDVNKSNDNPGGAQATPTPFPNYGVAPTRLNQWGYIQSVNIDTGAVINGSVGLPLTGNGTFLLAVNSDALSHLNIELAGVTGSGNVTVTASGYGEDVAN